MKYIVKIIEGVKLEDVLSEDIEKVRALNSLIEGTPPTYFDEGKNTHMVRCNPSEVFLHMGVHPTRTTHHFAYGNFRYPFHPLYFEIELVQIQGGEAVE